MAVIGFIGLGNMGLPMARNLVRAGHRLRAFDLASASLEAAVTAGAALAKTAAEAAAGAEIVITMLPEGRHVRLAKLDVRQLLSLNLSLGQREQSFRQVDSDHATAATNCFRSRNSRRPASTTDVEDK